MDKPRGKAWVWLWTGLTSILVVGAVAFPFLKEALAKAPADPPPASPPTAAKTVEEGKQYYVLLHAIEVEPRDADGDSWDGGRAGPDVFYLVHWRDTEVFKSSTKESTLLARWSNSELGLGDVMGSISIDDSIKAARVTARPGESLEFEVRDEDLAADDVIARWSVPLLSLEVGEQLWDTPAPGLVQVRCRVIPIDAVDLGTLTR
ncbi:MAG: hypothetical protein AAGD14_12790 [Planctomycetota bacterium]